MPGARMAPATAARLRTALGDPAVVARYRDKVVAVEPYACLFWTGAVAARGHGRFWIADDSAARDYVVIAHRFGFALAYGFDALMNVEVVAHRCDNTLCQFHEHWRESTHAENKREWASRRHQLSGPLRDLRGARGRAVALRDAVRDGRPLVDVVAAGVRNGDRDQLSLWKD
jgi:hypothetical protein